MSDKCPVSDWATDFDIIDEDYNRDPAPVWKDLRERCPIAHTERYGGMWMATTYDDCQALVKMTDEISNRQVSIYPVPGDDLLAEHHKFTMLPITLDPPEHTPMRRIILPFFNSRAVEKYREHTEQLCNEMIDKFIDKGECDAAIDYAQQIPARVIMNLMGLDMSRVDEFVANVAAYVSEGFDDIDRRVEGRRNIQNMFAELLPERRKNLGDDYVSTLLKAEVEGRPLTDPEIINMCFLLLVAGVDTTWSSIGSALYHFASTPKDRKAVAENPDLFPTAIEELLRFHAPVAMGRIATTDVEYGGVTFKRGERLMLNFPSANRDPEMFEDPEEVKIDRKANRHITFGIGHHRCAGSNLARMEMDVALRTWFRRIPEFELTDPDAVRWAPGQVRGARRVPVRFPVG